jgi:pentatricopeptide repeat protein
VPKERLDSWKNIAEYLERSLRTVQRWHAYHGLPVRHFGGSKGSVFAYTDEIDRWLISLSEESRVAPLGEDEALELRKKRSLELSASADQMWEARSEGNIQTISGLYRKAIDEDLGNGAALVGLANAMVFCAIHGVMEGAVAYPRAQDALQRLAPADAASPGARCAAAWVSLVFERNWRQAQAGFDDALSRQPWMSFAVSGRSMLYAAEGNLEQAAACAWEAWKKNPLACSLGALLCWIHYLSKDLEQALDLARQVRASGGWGGIAATVEALSLLQTGSIAARIKSLEAIAGEFPENQTLRGALGSGYAMAGQTDRAEEMLGEMERMGEFKRRNSGYALALIALALDRRAEAIKWLEIAYEEGVLWSLAFQSDPILLPLHGDPRFEALLRKAAPGLGKGLLSARPEPAESEASSTVVEAV